MKQPRTSTPEGSAAAAPRTPRTKSPDEALAALVMLGFPKGAAEKAVRKLAREHPSAPVEEMVRMALKML